MCSGEDDSDRIVKYVEDELGLVGEDAITGLAQAIRIIASDDDLLLDHAVEIISDYAIGIVSGS